MTLFRDRLTPTVALVSIYLGTILSGGCTICPNRENSSTHDAGAMDVPAFAGSSWALIELQGFQIASGYPQGDPYIQFNAGEEFVGMAGCNRMFGKYSVDAGSIEFSEIGTTKMMCAEGMDTETRFLEALNQTTQFNWVGNTLELRDSADSQLARFIAIKSVE